MYTFLTELDKRPDGIINSSVTPRSSLATGLALYYDRASKAVTSTQFTGGGTDAHGRGREHYREQAL